MGTEKRQRQKELGRSRAEQARIAAERAAKRNRYYRVGGIVLAVVILFALVSLLTGKKSTGSSAAGSTTTTTTTTKTSASTTAAGAAAAVLKGPGAGATLTGATPCPKADGTSPRTTKFAAAPPTCIDATKTYTANVTTSKGSFVLTLDAKAAPIATNNFVVLSRYHFYDGIPFHRIVPDFVIQAGDPSDTPTGNGGPGYSFKDELPKTTGYPVGSLAMANSGPNTNGSQFFVVTGSQGATLASNYTLFGKVTSGMDVVTAIGKSPTAGASGDSPTQQIDITKITITES